MPDLDRIKQSYGFIDQREQNLRDIVSQERSLVQNVSSIRRDVIPQGYTGEEYLSEKLENSFVTEMVERDEMKELYGDFLPDELDNNAFQDLYTVIYGPHPSPQNDFADALIDLQEGNASDQDIETVQDCLRGDIEARKKLMSSLDNEREHLSVYENRLENVVEKVNSLGENDYHVDHLINLKNKVEKIVEVRRNNPSAEFDWNQAMADNFPEFVYMEADFNYPVIGDALDIVEEINQRMDEDEHSLEHKLRTMKEPSHQRDVEGLFL